MDGPPLTIFDRVDPSVLRAPGDVPPKADSTGKKPERRKRLRSPRFWQRVMRIAAPVVWVYVLVDSLVLDIEVFLVRHVPALANVLQYRLLAATLILVATATFWRKRYFILPVLYVVFYPAIVVGWIIPRYLWSRKSWTLVIGTSHAVVGLVGNFRRAVYLWAAFLVAVVLLSTPADWARVLALTLSLGLALWISVSMVVQALRPHKYMEMQAALFHRWAGQEDRFAVPRHLRNLHGETFDAEDSNQIVDRAANAVVTCYGGRFWALKLDDYVHGGTFPLFGALSILRYAFFLVSLFTIANQAVYAWRPTDFSVDVQIDLIAWIQLAGAGLAWNDVAGISPVGTVARLVALIAGILGTLVLGMVAVSVVVNYRYAQDGSSTRSPIESIRRDCDRLEELVHRDYFAPLETIIARLDTWGNWLVRGLVSLGRLAPEDLGLAAYFHADFEPVDSVEKEARRRARRATKARRKRQERARRQGK